MTLTLLTLGTPPQGDSVSSFVRWEGYACWGRVRMSGNTMAEYSGCTNTQVGCPHSESSELYSGQSIYRLTTSKAVTAEAIMLFLSRYFNTCLFEFQAMRSTASLLSTNLYVPSLNSSHGTHIDAPWKNLQRPLPMSLLLTLFCSIS